jgi:hypothetical protein
MLGKLMAFSKFRLQSQPALSRTRQKQQPKLKLKYETIRVIDTSSLYGAGRMQEGGHLDYDSSCDSLHQQVVQ